MVQQIYKYVRLSSWPFFTLLELKIRLEELELELLPVELLAYQVPMVSVAN